MTVHSHAKGHGPGNDHQPPCGRIQGGPWLGADGESGRVGLRGGNEEEQAESEGGSADTVAAHSSDDVGRCGLRTGTREMTNVWPYS